MSHGQLVFTTVIYGYLLYIGAELISDGSELLLLVPNWADLIGSVVLPVLGAVPDGLMVLFSGIGKNAAKKVSVGIGALAGSTIMLLTIPWYLAMLGGRVDIHNKEPQYGRPRYAPESWAKLTPGNKSWSSTGVGVGAQIAETALIMWLTALLYFVGEIPALAYAGLPPAELAARERDFMLAGSVLCLLAFCMYLYYMFSANDADEAADARIVEAIRSGELSLQGAMYGILSEYIGKDGDVGIDTPLLEIPENHPLRKKLSNVLIRFFAYYDVDHNKKIDLDELRCIMGDLHETANVDELQVLFRKGDLDKSGFIEYPEFVQLMLEYLQNRMKKGDIDEEEAVKQRTLHLGKQGLDDDEGGEEEDIPEDLQDLSPQEQQARIRLRSFKLMIAGTLLVTFISDPMTDCMAEIGFRLEVNPFYVAFVLAPIASNAAELTAAYNYALKKTSKSMTISLSTLEGAACMNNTFCLGIFFFVMWYNRLTWDYTAETISIVGVQVLVGIVAMKRVMNFFIAYLVLSLYPLSLVVVYVLENHYHIK
jgi:Ca2+/Na+ antiporter